jgi:hypothetical protein
MKNSIINSQEERTKKIVPNDSVRLTPSGRFLLQHHHVRRNKSDMRAERASERSEILLFLFYPLVPLINYTHFCLGSLTL